MKPDLYDISPALTPDIAVFPSDTPMSREVLLDTAKGDALTLSSLHATCHLGAHVDGANHYGGAGGVDSWALDRFLGRCQVVRADCPRGGRVEPAQLEDEIAEERLLIATGSWPDDSVFTKDYCGLSVALVEHMAARGVKTVGVDTPSVDTADSKDLPAHHAILEADIAIIEYLRLGDVPSGVYELIALPLKLIGFDASPVRAVLRSI